jgi:hypothetical protein
MNTSHSHTHELPKAADGLGGREHWIDMLGGDGGEVNHRTARFRDEASERQTEGRPSLFPISGCV